MKIFLIICAFNEQPRLPVLINKLIQNFPPERIIIVDDGSEPPLKINPKHRVWLLRHKLNLGKGSAMKTGIEFAITKEAEAVTFMDADLQHDPSELPLFISALNQGFDVVFGSRRHNLDTPLVRYLGNKFASLYIRFLFGIYVSDILSGYRALTVKAYQALKWSSDRYGVDAEIVARLGLLKTQLKWKEIPISSIYIDKYKGVSLVTAIKILAESIMWRISW